MPACPLAVATGDSIYITNPRSSSLPTLVSCPAKPTALAWSAHGTDLYACSQLGIHQLSLETLEWTAIIQSKGSDPPISCLVVKGEESPRVVFGAGSELCVWDQRRQRAAPISRLPSAIDSIQLNATGTFLAVRAARKVSLLDLSTVMETCLNQAAHERIPVTCFHPSDPNIFFLLTPNRLAVYDVRIPEKRLKALQLPEVSIPVAIAHSSFASGLVAVADASGTVVVLDWKKSANSIVSVMSFETPIETCHFVNGQYILCGSSTGLFHEINLKDVNAAPRTFAIDTNGSEIQLFCMASQSKSDPSRISSKPGLRQESSKENVMVSRSRHGKEPELEPSTQPADKVRKVLGERNDRRAAGGIEPVVRSVSSSLSPATKHLKGRYPVQPTHALQPSLEPDPFQADEIAEPAPGKRSSLPQPPENDPPPSSTSKYADLGRGAPVHRLKSRVISEGHPAADAERASAGLSRRAVSDSHRRASESTPKSSAPSVSSDGGLPPYAGSPGRHRTRIEKRVPSPPIDGRLGQIEESADEHIYSDAITLSPVKPTRPSNTSSSHTPIAKSYLPRQVRDQENALQISPMRQGRPEVNVYPPDEFQEARERLREVVRDVMHEVRQDERQDMVALHLDIIRAGRGWKSEMRRMMREQMSMMRELQEDNARLRRENELLRRAA